MFLGMHMHMLCLSAGKKAKKVNEKATPSNKLSGLNTGFEIHPEWSLPLCSQGR